MRVAITVSALLCGACVADFKPTPDWTREGEVVTVHGYGTDEDTVCPGTFDALDRVALAIADEHGFDLDGLNIDYHYVDRDRFFDEPWCPGGASACAGEGRVKSPTIPHFHELSHAVDQVFLPYRSSPLAEGFATIHRSPTAAGFELDRHAGHDAPEHWGDIVAILLDQPTYAAQFSRVGHFTSFLVDRYGIEATNDLSGQLPEDATFGDWRRKLDQTLGEPFGDVIDHYANYPHCTTDQYRSKLWECAGEPEFATSAGADPISLDVELDCGDSRAIGVEGGTLLTYRRFVVEGTDTANYHVQLRDGGTLQHGRVLIERCDLTCPEDPIEATVWGQPTPSVEGLDTTLHGLAPGDYAVVIRGSGAYTLDVEPMP